MGPSPKRTKDEEAIMPVTPTSQSQTITAGSTNQDNLDDGLDPVELARRTEDVPVAVVEQRVSNLAQGSLCLVLLTGPFLHVLNLIPRGA